MARQHHEVTFELVGIDALRMLFTLVALVTAEAAYRMQSQPHETRGDWLARTGGIEPLQVGEAVLHAHMRIVGGV